MKPAHPLQQDADATFIPLVRLSQCQSDCTKMDSNAPLAVGAGLKPAQPLQQDADAIFIPLCGLHKNIVIPNAATAE